MPNLNEPLLSAEQRNDVGQWLGTGFFTTQDHLSEAVRALLADHARLTTQVEALATECAYLSHDHLEEGGAATRRLIERAVSAEREACAADLEGETAIPDDHIDGAKAISCGCNDCAMSLILAKRLRSRGPILPPLPPTVMAQRYEEMREALARIVELFEQAPTTGADRSAIEAARELLGRGK